MGCKDGTCVGCCSGSAVDGFAVEAAVSVGDGNGPGVGCGDGSGGSTGCGVGDTGMGCLARTPVGIGVVAKEHSFSCQAIVLSP